MAYLIFIIVSLVLFGGFFFLASLERARGARVLAAYRDRLDAQIGRIEFIIAHVDFKSFAREEVRRLATQSGHALAHLSLRAVRAVERGLTRVVRYLRARHGVEVHPVGETREFVKTLTDFKDRLKDTMPEVPSVHDQE